MSDIDVMKTFFAELLLICLGTLTNKVLCKTNMTHNPFLHNATASPVDSRVIILTSDPFIVYLRKRSTIRKESEIIGFLPIISSVHDGAVQ